VQEFGWVRWKTKQSRISKSTLPETIQKSFDLLYSFFKKHDDFIVSEQMKRDEIIDVLSTVESTDFYKSNIRPREEELQNEEVKNSFRIDGYEFSFSPLHKKMSTSQHVSVQELARRSRVLSKKDLRTLESEGELELKDVRLAKIRKRKKKTVYRFDVISTVEEEKLSTYMFVDNGELYINYDPLHHLDMSHPCYYDGDDPFAHLHQDQYPKMPNRDIEVGERFNIILIHGAWGLVVHKFFDS
jgi:hypothetical protein